MKKELKEKLWEQLPPWAWRLRLMCNPRLDEGRGGAAVSYSGDPGVARLAGAYTVEDVEKANLVSSASSSLVDSDCHYPVLDIDFPVYVVPSTTEGHYHLYIHKEMSWPHYRRLLRALAECGILEIGYVQAAIARGYTAVRPPWVRKPPATVRGEAASEAAAPEAAPEAVRAQQTEEPRWSYISYERRMFLGADSRQRDLTARRSAYDAWMAARYGRA